MNPFTAAILAVSLSWAAGAAAAPALPQAAIPAACERGVLHVALLSPAQLCPRPLATAVVARKLHRILHT